MSEFQNIKGVPLVVRKSGTGEVSIIQYADRTDLTPQLEVDVDKVEEDITHDAFEIKLQTEEAKQDALDDLQMRQDTITDVIHEGRRRDPDLMRPIGSTVVTRTISPPSRLQMHIESDKEHTDIRRTS